MVAPTSTWRSLSRRGTADGPGRVAEVAPQLAEHRAGRSSTNDVPCSGSNRSIDLSTPNDPDLEQVVERLAPVGEAAGAVAGHPGELLDERGPLLLGGPAL